MAHQGIISIEQLKRSLDTGEIDTVISAVCDMQGRLVGKRVTGSPVVTPDVQDTARPYATILQRATH